MHEQAVQRLLEPAEATTGMVAAIKFSSPDITPALDVKEYYCQLADRLQVLAQCSIKHINMSCSGSLFVPNAAQ